MAINLQEHEAAYRRMTTAKFAHMVGRSYSQVRTWARKNNLLKAQEYIDTMRAQRARAYWARRVSCAIDEQGLSHAIARRRNSEDLNSRIGEMRMLCHKKFTPSKINEKDFPACVKCRGILYARHTKPKNPPVKSNLRRRYKSR